MSWQSVGLGIPAPVHGRKTKRARYESLGVRLPETDRDLRRIQQGVELLADTTTPAQQVRRHNNHRKDALQLHSGYRLTQKGSRPSDGCAEGTRAGQVGGEYPSTKSGRHIEGIIIPRRPP